MSDMISTEQDVDWWRSVILQWIEILPEPARHEARVHLNEFEQAIRRDALDALLSGQDDA